MKNLNFFKNVYSFKRLKLEKLSLKHLKDIHEYSKNKRFFKYFEYQHFKKKIVSLGEIGLRFPLWTARANNLYNRNILITD